MHDKPNTGLLSRVRMRTPILVVIAIAIFLLGRASAPSGGRANDKDVANSASRVRAPIAGTATVKFPNGAQVAVSTLNVDYANWWRKDFPTWERRTFEVFAYYLDQHEFSTYLGFGEWIGPTVLFGSLYVQRAFGIEPDAACRTALKANVAANPALAAKTVISHWCIADKSGQLTMHGTGGSGSFVEGVVETSGNREYAEKYPSAAFSVTCIPLSAYITEHAINLTSTFLKMDCEGCEWVVLPSMYDMLAALPKGKLPTLFISIHINDRRDTAAFVRVAKLFRFAAIVGDNPDFQAPESGLSADFTTAVMDKVCSAGCDVVLTDLRPPLAKKLPLAA